MFGAHHAASIKFTCSSFALVACAKEGGGQSPHNRGWNHQGQRSVCYIHQGSLPKRQQSSTQVLCIMANDSTAAIMYGVDVLPVAKPQDQAPLTLLCLSTDATLIRHPQTPQSSPLQVYKPACRHCTATEHTRGCHSQHGCASAESHMLQTVLHGLMRQ